jgi:hypothetical protein
MSDVTLRLVDERVVVQLVADRGLVAPLATAAAEAAVASALSDLEDQIGTTPTVETVIGNPLVLGSDSASPGVWIDHSNPIPAGTLVTGASGYMFSPGTGAGSFVFVSADGTNRKFQKNVAVTGASGRVDATLSHIHN